MAVPKFCTQRFNIINQRDAGLVQIALHSRHLNPANPCIPGVSIRLSFVSFGQRKVNSRILDVHQPYCDIQMDFSLMCVVGALACILALVFRTITVHIVIYVSTTLQFFITFFQLSIIYSLFSFSSSKLKKKFPSWRFL